MTFPHRRTAVAPLLLCLILAVAMAGATPALGGPEGKNDHPPGHAKDKARPEQTPTPERSDDPPESAPEERGRGGGEGSKDGSGARGNEDHPRGGHASDRRARPHGGETTPPASSRPGGSPTPAPSGTKDPSDDVSLRLATSSGVLLGQVGQVVPYTIHVEVDEAVPRLVVTAAVAPEVDIASVPLNDRVETISSARRGPHEDIVWVLEDVPAASQFDLYWYGRVAAAGDLEATTTVDARAQEATAAAEARTFIAVAHTETTGATKPDEVLGKMIVRRVPVVRQVPASIAPAGSVLPVTGWSPAPMLWLAFACIALGSSLLLLSRTSPRVRHGAAVLVLIVLTACTLSTDEGRDPAAAPPSEPGSEDGQDPKGAGGEDDEQEPRDRVKGKVIYRDPAQEPETGAPAPEPVAPATTTQITYRRVVEEVPGQPAAQQPDREGDNTISFEWDEAGRSVANAASSTRLTAEQPSRLVTSLAWDRTGLISNVTLENTSSEPLHVRGTIVLSIARGSETVATLTSEPVDVVLAPDGSVRIAYRYLLPSGEYVVTSKFQT